MTQSLVIPKDLWPSLLSTITSRAEGRPVRIEVESMELGDQELADREPLRELDFETKGSAAGSLLISLGSEAEENVHVVKAPKTLVIGVNEGAFVEWLAIEEEEGSKTIIYFEHQLKLDVGAPDENIVSLN